MFPSPVFQDLNRVYSASAIRHKNSSLDIVSKADWVGRFWQASCDRLWWLTPPRKLLLFGVSDDDDRSICSRIRALRFGMLQPGIDIRGRRPVLAVSSVFA